MDGALKQIRWPIVIGAGVAAFMVGGAWYAGIFPTLWVDLHGFSEDKKEAVQSRFALNMATMFALDIVRAVVVAVLLAMTGRRGAAAGVALALLLWAGVSLPFHASFALSSGAPLGAFAIDASYRFSALLITGFIVGAWGLTRQTGEQA
jgi:uncharacterized membrane protein YqjE